MAKKAFPLKNLDEVGRRLAEARGKAGFNQTAAADKLIMSQQNLSRYEAGKVEPSPGALLKFSETYNVSVDWLLTGKATPTRGYEPPSLVVQEPPRGKLQRFSQDVAESGNYIPIPLLEDAVAAGAPAEITESDRNGWALIYASRKWLKNPPENYTCCHVRGRSMWPILDDGFIVAIDHTGMPPGSKRALKALDGEMVVFRVDGGITIKWLKFMQAKDEVVGLPHNRDEVDHLVVLKGEEINEGIVGKVAWWWGKR